jgi:HSP20 family protein
MSTMLRPHHEPFRDFATFRDEMERFFREGFGGGHDLAAAGWSPESDLEENDDSYVLHVELPGVKPEDISVSVEDGVLTVTGERRFYDEKETEGFRRIERRFGSFHRSLQLPGTIDTDQVTASYRDGVLGVTVPKAEDTKPHRVKVEQA